MGRLLAVCFLHIHSHLKSFLSRSSCSLMQLKSHFSKQKKAKIIFLNSEEQERWQRRYRITGMIQ
jgi:hypothetical protein